MSKEKWINIITIGMSLVLIVAFIALYTLESGGTEPAIPVTGNREIPSMLCCSRAHGKIHSVAQSIQSDTDETTSPSSQ